MSRMTSGRGALFQEGPGGRIIEFEDWQSSQVDAMRLNIKRGVMGSGGDRRKVIWVEIPKDQESNYLNSGGFAIQGANSIYTETKGSDKIPDPGQDVGAWAENLASRIDQTEGVQKTPVSTVIPTPTTTPSMASTQGSLIETVARSAASTSTITPSAASTSTITPSAATQGPPVEIVGREKASSREDPLTIQRTEMPSGTIEEGTGLIETMSRSTSSSTIETPNEDIVKDMYEAMRRGGTFRTGRTSRTGMQSGRLDIRPYELRPDEIQDDLSIMPKSTKDPLIKTIPRLRGQ